MRKLYILAILLPLFFIQMSSAAQDRVAELVNSYRKSLGIENEITVDTSLNKACLKVSTQGLDTGFGNNTATSSKDKTQEVLKVPGKGSQEQSYWEFLRHRRIYDVNIRIFNLPGNSIEEALSSDSIAKNPKLNSVLADKEFNRIGYLQIKSNNKNSIKVVITKRFFDFPKPFPGLISFNNGMDAIDQTETISGRAFVADVSYEVGVFKDISSIKPSNPKLLNLDSNMNFELTVKITPELKNKLFIGGVAFFDRDNRLLAFIKL